MEPFEEEEAASYRVPAGDVDDEVDSDGSRVALLARDGRRGRPPQTQTHPVCAATIDFKSAGHGP